MAGSPCVSGSGRFCRAVGCLCGGSQIGFLLRLLLFQIIIVVSNIINQCSHRQIENPGRSFVDEISVMGDVENGSGVMNQRVFQNLLRGDIQMVGRLIEDQEVRLREHQLRQGNTPAFAAAQIADALKDIVAGEEKCRQHISDLRVVHIRVGVLQLVKERLVHVQNLVFLIVVTDMHLGT